MVAVPWKAGLEPSQNRGVGFRIYVNDSKTHSSHLFPCPSTRTYEADCTNQADDLERRLRSVPSALGFKEVLVPSDLEHRSRTTRVDGILVPDDVWKMLTELATDLGLS